MTSPRLPLPRGTDGGWTTTVIRAARLYQWRVAHFRPIRTATGWITPVQGDAGSPDLLLARGGVVILAECKAGSGRPTQAQREWAEAIGAQYRLWRPEMWDSIIAELRG